MDSSCRSSGSGGLSSRPLAPNGQAACRLFYDAEAKKLFDEASGPIELKNLERVYSAYFITSVGDNAADRLGDLYFEQGKFDRAADCWMAVLRERPDTDLSPALLSVKAAVALSRAGRQAESEQLRRELSDRYNDEKNYDRRPDRAYPAAMLDQLLGDANKTTDIGLVDTTAGAVITSTRPWICPAWSNPPGNCGSPRRSKRG